MFSTPCFSLEWQGYFQLLFISEDLEFYHISGLELFQFEDEVAAGVDGFAVDGCDDVAEEEFSVSVASGG